MFNQGHGICGGKYKFHSLFPMSNHSDFGLVPLPVHSSRALRGGNLQLQLRRAYGSSEGGADGDLRREAHRSRCSELRLRRSRLPGRDVPSGGGEAAREVPAPGSAGKHYGSLEEEM